MRGDAKKDFSDGLMQSRAGNVASGGYEERDTCNWQSAESELARWLCFLNRESSRDGVCVH